MLKYKMHMNLAFVFWRIFVGLPVVVMNMVDASGTMVEASQAPVWSLIKG